MAAQLETLPRWEMTTLFPSLESTEFTAAFDAAKRKVADLVPLFDGHSVRRREEGPVGPAEVQAFEEVTNRLSALYEELRTLRAFINSFVTTDAANDTAQMRLSELQTAMVTLEQLRARYTAWVGTLDAEALLAASAVAREHAFMIRKSHVLARHQMPEGEENLAADLQPASLAGWARLHGDATSLLSVTLTLRGEVQTLPMSAVRALAHDPDREVRRAAYEAELRAWENVAVPLAAALNGIKGWQHVLNRRRGFRDDVEPTLVANNIDRETLEAMQQAVVSALPDFRRYLRAKARALGVEQLPWYDINAPVGAAPRDYPWREAEAFIRDQFGRYSARMAGLAERAFGDRWIDAGPRPGKQGGAFCMVVRRGESRILMNYGGSFDGVGTLAHELGHAYHTLNMESRTFLQSATPSTLAETASIFCETLTFDAALERAEGPERLALLDASLQRDLLTVVDIHSRFLFEKAVFERRARRTLTPREFRELMLDAQRQTYGDGLDGEQLHPYMWAVKGHYYGPMFYNYPYTFGLLFGLGLYRRYQEDPDGFRARYDDLLSSTGLADAATLAQRFGIDVRGLDFWRSSLDVVRENIATFERLV
jgi:oligoendopeptidase F